MKSQIIPALSSPRSSRTVALIVAVSACSAMMSASLCAEPPVTVESQTSATAGKPVLVVSESGKSQTLDAEGRDINIDGSNNDVTLRGKCHALSISGNENTVHAEALASISTSGSKNRVTWMEAVDGEKPQITDAGSGNSIEHGTK